MSNINWKRVIDIGVWIAFFIFFGFTTLVFATQNAVPGDTLFGAKLGVEQVLIASSRFLNKQADLQIEFVARRFTETTKVIGTTHAEESLARLDTQVGETADSIYQIQDPVERKRAAVRYVNQLNAVSYGLKQEQNRISGSTSPAAPSGQSSGSSGSSQPTGSTSGSNTTVADQIDNTQQTIDQTIQDMNNIQTDNTPGALPTPTMAPEPTATPTTQIEQPTATPTTEFVQPTAIPTTPPEPTATPTVPQEPTATPTLTLQEQILKYCQEHPNKCDGKGNDN